MRFRSIVLPLALVAAVTSTGGCVVAIGGAALGSAMVLSDRRSTGIQVEDAEIEHRVNDVITQRFGTATHVDVASYDQRVLLTGNALSAADRAEIERLAAGCRGVRQVINEIRVGTYGGARSFLADAELAGKVRSALLEQKTLPGGVVQVVCSDGTVYLMGLVGAQEAQTAESAVQRVSGVRRVVALFEVLTDAQLAQYRRGTAQNPSAAPAAVGSGQ